MKKIFQNLSKLIVLPVALLTLTGCATIFGDNTRTLTVNSNPQGAGIYIDGQRYGTTPASITLPSYIYGGKAVVLKKEGYNEQVMMVNSKFQPCGLWNLLVWPGFIIDGATGNTVKIDPIHLNMTTELQAAQK